MYRYKYQGRCDVHGLVYTSGYSLSPPPLCPIDEGNTYIDPKVHTRRLEPVYVLKYSQLISTNKTSYAINGNISWPGTNDIGFLNKIEILAVIDSGTTGYVKIYDETNDKDICEISNISGTELKRYETTSISNLSLNEAIWSFQLKVDDITTLQIYEVLCK